MTDVIMVNKKEWNFINIINNIIGGKIMLKKHFTILLLLVIMTAGTFAQSIPSGTARFEALGYNPFIMDAAIDINRNPAWGSMYRNYAFGDLGRATGEGSDFFLDDQYVGVNFGLGKMTTLGLVLNKDESAWGLFNDPFSSQRPDTLTAPIVPLKLLFTYATKKLSLGIAPYYASFSRNNNFATSENVNEVDWSSSSLGGTIGAISTMKTGWVELAVDFKLNKFKRESTNSNPASSEIIESEGGMQLGAFVRGWLLVNKPHKVNLVPYVNFAMYSWNPKVTTSPTATTTGQTDLKYFTLNGGVGMNMPILDDGLLAGGVSTGLSSYERTANDTTLQDVKIDVFTLPQFNIGLEWSFADWFTARMGYSRSVMNVDETYTGTGVVVNTQEYKKTVASNPDQTINIGAGFHFDRFSIDGTIGEKFFQRGPWVLSGRSTDLFGVLSASYNFNK
jgi:hypothetical protein